MNACGWAWSASRYSSFPNYLLGLDRSGFVNGSNALEELPDLTPESLCETFTIPGVPYKAHRRSAHTVAVFDGAFTSCGIGLTCGPQDPNLNSAARYNATSSNVVWLDPMQEGEYRLFAGMQTSGNADEAKIQIHDIPGLRLAISQLAANGDKFLVKPTGTKMGAYLQIVTGRYYAFHLAGGLLYFGYAGGEKTVRANLAKAIASNGAGTLPDSTWAVSTSTFANGVIYLNMCMDDYAEGVMPLPW